jgi:DNA processing protein
MCFIKTDKLEKLIDLLALRSINGVGVGRFYQLVNHFGSPSEVLKASVNNLTDIPGIGRETALSIGKRQNFHAATELADKINKNGWKLFMYDDANYPEPLKNVVDRPPCLFYLGDYTEKDHNAIAIVGSRSSSEAGRLFTEKLATDLASNGITIISGMARGIDTAAHKGAIRAGKRTIAVFGSSLDIVYPPEGRDLANKIAGNGCIFSEYPPGTKPDPHNFPERNRIISGLSQGVVVIEAAKKSGALSTAAHAISQNREVFAVPGPPNSAYSIGTNRLIKEGARLLTSSADIFAELPRLKGRVKVKNLIKTEDLTDTEKSILKHFAESPVHIDNLSRKLETPMPDLLQILLALELKGIIKELSGKRYILG